MLGNVPNRDALVLEAATAISTTRTVEELEQRMGVLQDRAEVDTNSLAAFIVSVPEGYDADDRAVFVKHINEILEGARIDAACQVEYDRMWNRG